MTDLEDHLPKEYVTTRTYKALQAAGFQVQTSISYEHRPTAEVEAGKIARQADRMVDPYYDRERGYLPTIVEQEATRAARLAPHIEEKRDWLAYWDGGRAAQVETGRATGCSRRKVQKGDKINVCGCWYEVARVNTKSVSVATGYSWTDTVPYAEIRELKAAENA